MRAVAILFDITATLIPSVSLLAKRCLFAIFLCTILILSGCSSAPGPAAGGVVTAVEIMPTRINVLPCQELIYGLSPSLDSAPQLVLQVTALGIFAPLDDHARHRQIRHYCTPPILQAAPFWIKKKHQRWRCFFISSRGAGI